MLPWVKRLLRSPSVLSVSSVVTFPPASTGYKPNLPIRFMCRTENVFV